MNEQNVKYFVPLSEHHLKFLSFNENIRICSQITAAHTKADQQVQQVRAKDLESDEKF